TARGERRNRGNRIRSQKRPTRGRIHARNHQVGIREETGQACHAATGRHRLKGVTGRKGVEMSNMTSKANFAKRWLGLLLVGTLNLPAAERPADRTLPVRGFCIASPSGNRG